MFAQRIVSCLKYLSYVLRHKWHVLAACWRVGLYWRGLAHDLSKLRPSEFFAYADFFYGGGRERCRRDSSGYYNPDLTGHAGFDRAWFLHQRRNPHHWQYWATVGDDGEAVYHPMPPKCALEMICDWVGAGRAQGSRTTVPDWHRRNCGKIHLDPVTESWVRRQMCFMAKALELGLPWWFYLDQYSAFPGG